ncbi:MAG: hypothetical protein CMF31_05225 [Kordiimonas sp.]|nr:hypothetical protein [Kordiimonas sp.]|tara:strand:- start:4082 stop:4774 length:693 start_codon:yes stop_codon:yes gene_type:complete
MAIMKNRLKTLRQEAGFSQAELGEKAGTTKLQIWRLEHGERQLTQRWMERLAPHLDCRPEELIAEISPPDTLTLSPISVIGYVQAGDWAEAHELPEDDRTQVVLPNTAPYSTAFGLQVRGDSMNLKYEPGDIVVCVPYADYDKEITTGKCVIVELECFQGLIESTVKELHKDDNGTIWLVPRSSNPIHQAIQFPNHLPETEEDLNLTVSGRRIREIRVQAVVIGFFRDDS